MLGIMLYMKKTSIKIQLKFKSSISLVSVASVRTRKDREPGSSRVQMDRTNFKEMNIRLNIRTTAPNLCNRGGEYNVHYYELKKSIKKKLEALGRNYRAKQVI